MVKHVRPEETLAEILRETRRGLRDVQRATGTEKARTMQTVEGLAVDVESVRAQAEQAIEDAANAQTTSNGKNARRRGEDEPSPPAGGWVSGDQWIVDNADGDPVEVRVWDGTAFVHEQLLASELLILSGGLIRLANGVVTADAIAADAIDGMVITGAIIRTAASGQRLQLDVTGLRAFDSLNAETARLEAATGGLRLSSVLLFGETDEHGGTAQIFRHRYLPRHSYTDPTHGLLHQGADYAAGTLGIWTLDEDEKASRVTAASSPERASLLLVANPTTDPDGSYNARFTKRPDKSLVIDNGGGRILIATENRPDAESNTWPAIRLNPGPVTEDSVEIVSSGTVELRSPAGKISLNAPAIESQGHPYPARFAAGTIPAQSVTAGGVVSVTVTLPAGRFTVPPVVIPGKVGNARDTNVSVDNITSSSFTFRLESNSGAARTIGGTWHAIQMLHDAAGG